MLWNTKNYTNELLSLRMLKRSPIKLAPLNQEKIKQNIMQAVRSGNLRSQNEPAVAFHVRHWSKVLGTIFSGLAIVAGTAFAAGSSNPGDVLYPVKLAQEQVRLTLTPSEKNKAQLQASFAKERMKELKTISSKNKVIPAVAKPSNPVNDEVKNSTKKAVVKTLHDLNNTEKHLKKQGKNKEAQEVQENLKCVKDEAKEQNLIDESEED